MPPDSHSFSPAVRTSASAARRLEPGHLFFEFNFARGGELVENFPIHKELGLGFRFGHALRDGSRRLVQRPTPGISS